MHLRGKGGFSFLVLLKTNRSTGSVSRGLLRRMEQTQYYSFETVLFFYVMSNSLPHKGLDVGRQLEVLQVLGAHN